MTDVLMAPTTSYRTVGTFSSRNMRSIAFADNGDDADHQSPSLLFACERDSSRDNGRLPFGSDTIALVRATLSSFRSPICDPQLYASLLKNALLVLSAGSAGANLCTEIEDTPEVGADTTRGLTWYLDYQYL